MDWIEITWCKDCQTRVLHFRVGSICECEEK